MILSTKKGVGFVTRMIRLLSPIPVFLYLFIFGWMIFTGLPVLPQQLSDTHMQGAFINTLYICTISILIVFIIGRYIAAFLFLYGDTLLGRCTWIALRMVSVIPSILAGLVGSELFSFYLGMDYSIIVGSCTMAFVLLPTIVFPLYAALQGLPPALKEGGVVLGASPDYVTANLLLPSVRRPMAGACVVAIGRILGESGTLLLTSGIAFTLPQDWLSHPSSSGGTLSVYLYRLSVEGASLQVCCSIGIVLLVLCGLFSLLAKRLSS